MTSVHTAQSVILFIIYAFDLFEHLVVGGGGQRSCRGRRLRKFLITEKNEGETLIFVGAVDFLPILRYPPLLPPFDGNR